MFHRVQDSDVYIERVLYGRSDHMSVVLPEIQAFFESEDGQLEYAEWKAEQQAEQENKA